MGSRTFVEALRLSPRKKRAKHYWFGVRTSSGLHAKYYYFETLTL